MTYLAIDTSLGACSLALCDAGGVRLSLSEPMTRGHQERLPVMAEEAFAQTGIAPSDLTGIVVTLGPGSFTGLRVGLAFAKGLAVGLNIPLKGMGTLEALAFHPQLLGRDRLAVVDGGRGQIYVQRVTGEGASAPEAFKPDMPAPDVLTGPAAGLLATHFPAADIFAQDWPLPEAMAQRAMSGLAHDDVTPIYMRDADAVASTRGIIDASRLKPA